jgi:hypothetical protein
MASTAKGDILPLTMTGDSKEIAQFEALAEAAYSAMYEARPHNVKDCYEDAGAHFQRAIDIAKAKGLADAAERLTRRRDHVAAVYNSQFRYAGR